MDNAAARIISSVGNYIKSSQVFEKELKERLKWPKEKWLSSKESGTRINRLCSSLHFWKRKLKPAIEKVSVIITLFNLDNDTKMELADIIKAVEDLDSAFVVKGIAQFRNPRYLCLYFESEEVRNKVKEKFRLLGDSYVVYMSWALAEESTFAYLKVHWLAMTVDMDLIKKALDKYVMCVEEERKKIKFMSGREMPSGKISFKVTLKKDVSLETIPHVMEIAGLEALITVSGRQALCLNCDTLGHISKNCKFRYCSSCRDLMPPGHNCTLGTQVITYASKVKPKVDEQRHIQSDDWGAEIIFKEQDNKASSSTGIEGKIADIENKIKLNESLMLQQPQLSRLGDDLKGESDKGEEDGDSVSSSPADDEFVEEMHLVIDNCDMNIVKDGYPEGETSALKDSKEKKATGKVRKKSSARKVKTAFKVTSAKQASFKEAVAEGGAGTLDTAKITRSYGRPVLDNERKRREQYNFEKIANKSPDHREFIFKD